jgi:hypothetical protein
MMKLISGFKIGWRLGMHRISGWPDIRPDNPAFFDIRYPAGYKMPSRLSGRISGEAG